MWGLTHCKEAISSRQRHDIPLILFDKLSKFGGLIDLVAKSKRFSTLPPGISSVSNDGQTARMGDNKHCIGPDYFTCAISFFSALGRAAKGSWEVSLS